MCEPPEAPKLFLFKSLSPIAKVAPASTVNNPFPSNLVPVPTIDLVLPPLIIKLK